MIKCENLSFAYDKENIFDNMEIEIESGQLTAIVGPNGAGKSTLLKCLCNLYQPGQGVVYIEGNEISQMKAKKLARTLGYVPQKQKPGFDITVYEMVLLGRKPYIRWRVTEKDEAVVESLLEKLDILELAEREVDTLSGGEKQKVAIARALAQEPEILFLDEPTSSLDINHQLEVMEVLVDLTHNENSAVVVVLHDLNLVGRYSDRVYLLGKRGIQACGEPEEVFTRKNIKQVYDIEVEIIRGKDSNYIIPLKSYDE